jgi:CheY-like chemotaxis protein
VDLAAVVARAVEAAGPGIKAAKHRLTVALPARPIFIEGDELRLAQAVTNILNNAARYTEPGGSISIALASESESGREGARLAIRDTGRGIEPELLGTIFGMFVQGRDAFSRPQAGLGVGLALARIIVELHHGTLEGKSEGAGKGSEFLVRLPMSEAASAAAPPKQRPEASAAKNPARRVLVVDDNVDAAAMLSALVRTLGHEVVTVHDGIEALQVSEGFRPEVIMLDIGMPGMNGYEVARRLRQRNRTPQPVLVAVTGWGKPDDEMRSREAGFDAHLVKPVEEPKIRQVLDTI